MTRVSCLTLYRMSWVNRMTASDGRVSEERMPLKELDLSGEDQYITGRCFLNS